MEESRHGGLGTLAAFAVASLGVSLLIFGGDTLTVSSAASRAAGAGPDLTALPLGDGSAGSSGAGRGRLYTCQSSFTGGGASVDGPWIHGSSYDLTAKYTVDGAVDWPAARFKRKRSRASLKLSGNGLPAHTTGAFPIQPSDDAYSVDRNPNSIRAQGVSESLPANPKRLTKPQCVGGEVGIARNGVAIFSAVDAAGRDAVAHEVQDTCSGHPQQSGVYHYHGLPACLGSGGAAKHSKQLGWALDGFPIYGPRGKGGDYLANAELDVCHGHTHTVAYGGERVRLFHYHANYEFPYTVGCFRGAADTAPSGGGGGAPPPMPVPQP